MSGSVSASADHGQGQHLTAVHLHGEDVQAHQQQAAADDGRQTHGKGEIAGLLDGPGTGRDAAAADEEGDERSLAVVAPVEMFRRDQSQ